MDITRVRFEAFRSLYDVSCDLDHFTVITGPNGSGKSNLVSALAFLGEVYAHGLEIALSRAGGYENVAHRRSRRATKPIALDVQVSIRREEMGRHVQPDPNEEQLSPDFIFYFNHKFAFKTSGQALFADYEVINEEISITDEDGRSWLQLRRTSSGEVSYQYTPPKIYKNNRHVKFLFRPYSDAKAQTYLFERPLPESSLLTDQVYFPSGLVGSVARAISRIRLFQLSPSHCRRSGVPTPNAALERNGENLPGAADHLRRNDPDAWRRVQSLMQSILPGLSEIQIAYTEDRRLALQFREHSVKRPWNTGEVSDGTVQALALLITLHDRRFPLLVIEEPENSVHPWILRQFIDICREVPKKQILLTTHSPVALNYVDPNIIRLMSIGNGRSSIHRLLDFDRESRQLVLDGDISAFELYDSGLILSAVPPGFTEPYREDDL